MTSVRFEPAALRSRVKQSTTEPLRSLHVLSYMAENRMEIDLYHTSFKIESKKTVTSAWKMRLLYCFRHRVTTNCLKRTPIYLRTLVMKVFALSALSEQ